MQVRKFHYISKQHRSEKEELLRWRMLGKEILHKLKDQRTTARDIGRVIERDKEFGNYVAGVASRLYNQELTANAVVRAVVMLGTVRLATIVSSQGWQQEFAV